MLYHFYTGIFELMLSVPHVWHSQKFQLKLLSFLKMRPLKMYYCITVKKKKIKKISHSILQRLSSSSAWGGSCCSVKSQGLDWCSMGAVRCCSPTVDPLSCLSGVLPQLLGMQYLQGCKNQVGFSHQLLLHKEFGARAADQGAGNISWALRTPFSSSLPSRQWEGAVSWSGTWQEQEWWGQQRKEGFITGRKCLKHWHFRTF